MDDERDTRATLRPVRETWRAWLVVLGGVAAYAFAATFTDPTDAQLPATALGTQTLLDLERAAVLFVGALFVLMVAEGGYRGSFPKSLGIGGISSEMHETKALASAASAEVTAAAADAERALEQVRQLQALSLTLHGSVEELRADRAREQAPRDRGVQ